MKIPVLLTGLIAALSVASQGQDIRLVQYRFDPLQEEAPAPQALTQKGAVDGLAPFIVQFQGPITSTDRAWLEAQAVILGYVPDYAFLVSASADVAQRLQQGADVRWVGLWEPAFKLCPQIGQQEMMNPDRKLAEEMTLRVTTHGPVMMAQERIQDLGAAVSEVHQGQVKDRLIVTAKKELVQSIAHLSEVIWVEELPESFLLNTTSSWVIQTNNNNQRRIWDEGIRGEGQMAVAMDSGLDYNSCWFRDPGKSPGSDHRKVKYYAYFGGAEFDGCSLGHGSHVCGSICGDQSFINPGTEDHNGMAPGADIGMQDVGNDDFFSCLLGLVFPPNDLTNAFQQAFNQGARVHTNSWGSSSNSYDGFAVDIDDFMFRNPDMLILFANGNSGPSGGSVGSPATGKNCVSVGATRQAPQQETMTGYSSRGPANDGRLKPTVGAPGGGDGAAQIMSVDNNAGDPPGNSCNATGLAGTSMATPTVAGGALLVRDYFAQGFYPTGEAESSQALEPTGALVKAVLINSAVDIGTANIPNNTEGWGRILLDDALYFDGDSRELRIEDERSGISTGEFREYAYEVEAGESLEVCLVWSDAPATQGANPALVNNLDLTVTGPSGAYLGNVFTGGESQTGGTADNRNVEECVRLSAPVPGTYVIRVDGTNVPNGPQHFALASTGSFDQWPSLCDNDGQAIPYGSGHPGTLGIPDLSSDAPRLGNVLTLNIGNSLGANTAAALFVGFAQDSVPGFGGTLLVDPSFVVPLVIPGTGVSLPSELPSDIGLCGVSLYLQILESDPGASEGISMSAGLELLLGS